MADEQPDPFPRKHPLEHRWTLWFEQKQQKFGEALRPIYTFDNVEDMWCLYANIKPPSKLLPPATYYLFKDNIEPKWEDPANANGGCWCAIVPRAPNAEEMMDNWWLHTVLACIGEAFDEGDDICGVTLSVRHGKNRVEVWTRTAANEAMQVSIGKQLKAILKTPDTSRIGYSFFSDKMHPGKPRERYYA